MTRRIPTLETERLIVRELSMDDLVDVNAVLDRVHGSDTSPEGRRPWLQWTVLGYDMFAGLEQPHYGERAVAMRQTGDIIGVVGVVPYLDTFDRVPAMAPRAPGRATAEVGLYWAIDPQHRGRGFATEAARALMEYLFTHEQLGRVLATTGYDNTPSQRVMEKLGMTIHRVDPPQPPDQFVVGVRENDLQG